MTPADPEDGTKANPTTAEEAQATSAPAAPKAADSDAAAGAARPVAEQADAVVATAPAEAVPAPATIGAAPVEAKPEEAGESPRRRRRWPWVALLMVVLAAVLGMALGVGVVLRGRSFGAQLAADRAARPTFVIAAPPSPSPSGSPRASATAAAPAISSEEYVVEAGDTLRSIARQVYGDPAQWPRIYDANRETIGPDPDTLSAGTKLRIPRP